MISYTVIDFFKLGFYQQVCRTWHIDVAKFLLELGANVNQADKYGRTPLHVAAAVDYPEMVEILIKNGGKCYRMV